MSTRVSYENPVTGKIETVYRSSKIGRAVLADDHDELVRLCLEVASAADIRDLMYNRYRQRDALVAFAGRHGRTLRFQSIHCGVWTPSLMPVTL